MAADYDYARRAEQIADASRRFFIGLNAGGIVIALMFATRMSEQGVHPRWMVFPVLLFALGLCTSAFGLWYAKYKSAMRQNAARAGLTVPTFNRWYQRSVLFELIALIFFWALC